MATNQELRHQSFRDIAGTAGTYNEDWLACITAETPTATGTINERIILWVNDRLTLDGPVTITHTNINDALNALAVDQGYDRWDSVGTILPKWTVSPPAAQLQFSTSAPTVAVA